MASDEARVKVVEKSEDEDESKKPVVRKLSYSAMRSAKRSPERRAIIQVSPEEVDIDPEEFNLNPGDTFGILVRPFRPNEDTEIREIVKDFPEEEWTDEYYKEICLRCIEDVDNPGQPMFPNTAEGRKQLERWLPGTRANVVRTVQNQSGMGVHIVKNAKDELGKLQGLPLSTSSTSGSVRNIA